MAKKYKLRQVAREDIKEIGRYTLKKFGPMQRTKYLEGMNDKFVLLGNKPTAGRLRNDIKEGYYSIRYEKHVIFYLIRDDYVEIMSVLHVNMLPALHL